MKAFWVYLTDGTERRRTVIEAPDEIFALMKAAYFFEGSRWRIVR